MAFVKFTLNDIRTSVKRKLDDQSFDTATIDEAANDFQFELFNDHRIRFMEQATNLATVINATSVNLPVDFMNLIRMTVLDSATVFRNLTRVGFLEYESFMELFPNYTVLAPQKVFSWTFFGEGIRFSAPLLAAYTISIDYLRSPVLMVNASDTCELPINCRELMTLGALQRVMRVNEDYNESDAEWQHLQRLKTSFIRNYGRGGAKVGPQVIGRGRRRILADPYGAV